ncbi:MAG: 3-hydroxyacyl-CoA dehydrogenase family protein [Oscillospiraceae bacterium]|nr:3-hydroxyacyl-CoA dehydrogenase family protein [Oscillospiraceae bacterium]
MRTIKNVTVIGAGLMGNALAQVFASSPDISVILRTRQLTEDRYAPIEKNLDIMIARGAATEAEKKAILANISFETDLKKATENADFVIECWPEVMETKQNLFQEIEGYCSEDTILATNTSVMSITEISEKCKHKARVVGAHFWNPGHLIPLVEVVKSKYTSEDVMQDTITLLKKVGKHPIYCKKDVPGFVANRIQHAVWREAFSMVENGIADAATVDEAIRFGPGLRWPILGPMENADMTGLPLAYNIHSYIFPYLEDTHEPSPLLQEMIDRGELGFKTGKGFQDWTPEQIEASNTRLREYLIDYHARNKK